MNGLPQVVVMVSINSTSEEVRSQTILMLAQSRVSINSTSEEVRSILLLAITGQNEMREFPLIQLPRKSEATQVDLQWEWDGKSFH